MPIVLSRYKDIFYQLATAPVGSEFTIDESEFANEDELERFCKGVEIAVSEHAICSGTLHANYGQWTLNLYANQPFLKSCVSFKRLAQGIREDGYTQNVLVVGNGPTAETLITNPEQYAAYDTVVACWHVQGRLDVRCDYVVHADCRAPVMTFNALSPNTTAVATATASHEFYQLAHASEVPLFVYYDSQNCFERVIAQYEGEQLCLPSSCTVATTCINVGVMLGAKTIGLVGVDLQEADGTPVHAADYMRRSLENIPAKLDKLTFRNHSLSELQGYEKAS